VHGDGYGDGRGGQQGPAAEGQDREHGQRRDGGGGPGPAARQDARRGHGAAQVDAQEHRGRHAEEQSGVGQPDRGQRDQHQAGQGDEGQEGTGGEPGRIPLLVRFHPNGYGGELS
jgi:hypothetical protein